MHDGQEETSSPATGEPLVDLISAFDRLASGNGDGAANEALRNALTTFCAHARAEKLSPEEVLIRVKRALDRSPTFRQGDPMSSSATRAHIISLAIKTYFSDRNA